MFTKFSFFRRLKLFFTNRDSRKYYVSSFLYVFSPKKYYRKWKYSVSIVCIVKDESPYIQEWIRFHILGGIEHFYIFDNGSSDNTACLLLEYVQKGIVTLLKFPGERQQIPAYKYAAKKYWKESKYLAFIDADEFLYPSAIESDIKTGLNYLSGRSKWWGGLVVPWIFYGTSGYDLKPQGGVIDTFVYRGLKPELTIKTIVQSNRVYDFSEVHFPTYYWPYRSFDERGDVCIGASVRRAFESIPQILRLNHYATKSKQEWVERQKKGKADGNGSGSPRWEIFSALDRNEVFDDSAQLFVSAKTSNGYFKEKA